MIIIPITMPAASALSDATLRPSASPSGADPGREAERGEKAEHDGRDAGEDFQDRLGEAAEARRRVLRHVDGGEQADRPGDQHRDDRDQQRAGDQRHDAEGARRADLVGADRGLRAPLRAEQEVERRDLLEEPHGLEQHREHDADGGQHRDAWRRPSSTILTTRSTWLRARNCADSGRRPKATPSRPKTSPPHRRSACWPARAARHRRRRALPAAPRRRLAGIRGRPRRAMMSRSAAPRLRSSAAIAGSSASMACASRCGSATGTPIDEDREHRHAAR